MVQTDFVLESPRREPPRTFAGWRRRVGTAGMAPVIAVAGSRGKTTVVRLLDAIFRRGGLRTALWTDRGVEVDGRRQSGELVPWSRAIGRAARGELDVAIQELDWATIHAVGLPPGSYPVAAITNLCVNNDSCLVQIESRRALRALDQVRAAAAGGALILNGEDFAVSGDTRSGGGGAYLIGISGESPAMRGHLAAGGAAAWCADGLVTIGDQARAEGVGRVERIAFSLGGAIGFQLHNALTAATVARVCGLPPALIADALATYAPAPRDVPGSFNLVAVGEATFVVDRPAPSWFLRPSLRALAHIPARRVITLVGALSAVPDDDLWEVGRLLGRSGGLLILSESNLAEGKATSFRHGVGSNDLPPLVIRAGTERQALNTALRLVQPGDLVLCLVRDALPALRALERAAARGST